MHYRSIWISDIHLGTKGCKHEELCKFLKENNCDYLYLVGDIVDGWRLSKNWYWPQGHSNVVRRFLTKAKRGTKIRYVVGNHDEFLRSWLKNGLNVGNIEVSNEFIHTDAKNRKWLVVHGDLFDSITRHYKIVSIIGDNLYHLLLSTNSLVNQFRKFFKMGYWSLSKYIKLQTKQAVNFIFKFEHCLTSYSKTKSVHGVICGHIHIPALKKINDVMYANDGDWVETCSALVETQSGEFLLLQLNISGEMEIVERYA